MNMLLSGNLLLSPHFLLMRLFIDFCGCFAPIADAFRGIYRNRPKDEKLKFPKIHVYGFSKAEDPEFEFHEVDC